MTRRFAIASALAAGTGACASAPRAETAEVRSGDARIAVRTLGEGAPVLLIPSLARGVEDFDALASALAGNGFQVILPDPRGIGGSSGPEPASLADLADDAAAVIDQVAHGAPVDVVGHAFGQRVARMLAARHPAKVRNLVLLAAGGRVPMPEDVRQSLVLSVSQGAAPDAERLSALQHVFFARGQDARVWLSGWTPDAARTQSAATQATCVDEWWGGGAAPVLVVQALEDPIAPPENAEALAREFGERVRVVRLPHASHAILPEQPEAVAVVVTAYLNGLRDPLVLQRLVDETVQAPAFGAR